MPVINKGVSFSPGEQLTSDKLNALLDLATFSASGSTDNSSLNLNAEGKLQVKDLGITPAKLSAGGPTWDGLGNVSATEFRAGNSQTGIGDFTVLSYGDVLFPLNNSNKIQFNQGPTSSAIYTTPGTVEIGADNSDAVNSSNVRFRVDNEVRMQVNPNSVFIRETSSAPGDNPSNGIYLYFDGTSLKYRDSNGTVRIIQTS